MKRGFTLIELLAVIVILAIIAVIAVPIVIDIIEDTKISSVKTSASMYLKAAELFMSNAELNKLKIEPGTYQVTKDGNICIGILEEEKCNGEIVKIEVKGSKPSSGQIIIDENTNIKIEYLEIDGYMYYKNSNEYVVVKGKKTSLNSDNRVITLNSIKPGELSNYKIYGNSYQETRSGKNLLDISQGITLVPEGGAYIENNILYTPYSSGNTRSCYFNQYIEVTANTTYTYNHDYTGGDRVIIMLYDENKTLIEDSSISIGSDWKFLDAYDGYYGSGKNHSVTIPENIKYVRFSYCKMDEVNSYYNIQFEKGTTATSYEEYGVMPSLEYPSEIQSVGDLVTDENDEHYGKYKIPIKVTGKNLFDYKTFVDNAKKLGAGDSISIIDGGIKLSQLNYQQDYTRLELNLKENTQYTISFKTSWDKYNNDSVSTGLRIIYSDGSYENVFIRKDTSIVKFTSSVEKTIVAISSRGWAYAGVVNITDIQIEEGTEATEYEPYKEEKYSIYLDQPLRKIEDYYDYIDFNERKVYRNVFEMDISSLKPSSFGFDSSASDKNKVTASIFRNTTVGIPTKISKFALCNYFTPVNVYYNQEGIRNIGTSKFVSFNILKSRLVNWDEDLSDTEKKEIISNYFAGLNNIKIYYQMGENLEPIELPQIKINKGVNNIFVDTCIKPSKISVNYYK